MLNVIVLLLLTQPHASGLSPDGKNASDLLAQYSTHWSTGDASALAALWTSDGDLVTLAGGLLQGQDAIRGFLQESLSNAPGSQFQSVVDVARRIGGDAILADGRWRLINTKQSAKPVEGVFTAVLVRKSDEWRFTALRISIPGGGHTRGINRTTEFPTNN